MISRDAAAVAALAVTVAAGAVAAQETVPSRLVELPAHRALMAIVTAPDATLAPFATDGCSGGLSEAWRLVADSFPGFAITHETEPPWESCCVIHDRAYHDAGRATNPEASFSARLAADRALESCVIETGAARRDALAAEYGARPEQVDTAYAAIAGAMFVAVRLGGAPCSGLPWRWGFGYPGCSVLGGFGTGDDLAAPQDGE